MVRACKLTLARFAIVATLVVVPVAAAGCGATSYVANGILHKVANTFVHSKKGRRDLNLVFCADSVYNAAKDFKHHHYLFGALSVHQALKNCEAGLSKNATP